ncbi:MAG: lipoprotein insertase outer membrane protein LolB [Arenicellales bacterium]|nr:lipoprotein insertase outer membrane protein LolB [Arenicellales bacterium]
MLPRILVAMIVLVTVGCATTPTDRGQSIFDPEAAWQQQKSELNNLTQWKLAGRIGLRTADSGATANLRWRRTERGDQIYLFGLLGGGKVQLDITDRKVELRDAKGQVFSGTDVTTLLYQVTGWHVPFNSLDGWLRGLPAPGVYDSIEIDQDGKLIRLHQAGWEISYDEFMPVGNLTLPKRIHLTAQPKTIDALVSTGHLSGDRLALKIFVEDWQSSLPEQVLSQ